MKTILTIGMILILAGLCVAQTPPTPPPPYDSASLALKGIAAKNISSGNAAAGLSFLSDGAGGGVFSTASASLNNAQVFGDEYIYGHVRQIGQGTRFDMTHPYVGLRVYIPDSGFGGINNSSIEPPYLCSQDHISIVHPNAILFPGGFHGWRIWSVFTINVVDGTACHEDLFLRVSQEGKTWFPAPGAPDPLFAFASITDTIGGKVDSAVEYYNDPDLFWGSDGKMWVGFNGTWANAQSDLFVSSSTDGATWSTPVRSKKTTIVAGTMGQELSPAIFLDVNGTYKKWTVTEWSNMKVGNDSLMSGSRILIDSALTPTGPWTLLDTVRVSSGQKVNGLYRPFPNGTDSLHIADDYIVYKSTGKYVPWHGALVDNGGDGKIVLLTCKNIGTVDSTRPAYLLFMGQTTDGRTITMNSTPILLPSYNGGWENHGIYKSTGWVEDWGGGKVLELLYGAQDTVGGTTYYSIGLADVFFPQRIDTSLYVNGTITNSKLASHTIDSTKEANAATSIEKINWPQEWLEFTNVYGLRYKTAGDSMMLSMAQRPNAKDTLAWLWQDTDTSGSAHSDTITMKAMFPYNCYADTLVINATDSTAASYIDSINVAVNPGILLAGGTDTSFAGNPNGTNYDAANTPTRITIPLGGRYVRGGEKIVATVFNYFAATRGLWIRCNTAAVTYRRAQ